MKNKKRINFKSYRWILYGILALINTLTIFHRTSAGTVKEDLLSVFDMSSVTFGHLSSIFFYVYMIMQLPAGILADTIGPRRVISSGVLLAGFGTIIFGMSNNIFQIFLGRLLIGLGVSVVYVSILKVLSQWYKGREFAGIMGLTTAVGNLGGILAQTPLVLLMALITWRNSFIALGIFSVFVAGLAYSLIRNRPSDLGFPLIDEDIEGNDKNHVDGDEKINLWASIKSVITNKNTWPLFFIFPGIFGTYQSFAGTWGPTYIMEVYGISKIASTNHVMAGIIGHMIGAVAIGSLSDKILKRKTPMRFFGFINLLAWGAIVFWNKGKPPIEYLSIILFVLGFTSALYLLTLSGAKEVNSMKIVGISTSIVNMGGFLGAGIFPPLLGGVIDRYKGSLASVMVFQKAFMYCFIAVVIANILMIFVKETNCRNVYGDRE